MSNPLSLVYFPSAVLLGALHALEPGHAKALTASYLIGIKGTKRDSVILGLSVAATHSIVVIAISALGLWIGEEAFAGTATRWLERGSGFVAVAIGSWMLFRRLSKRYRIEHHHLTDHQHEHPAPEPVLIRGKRLQGTLGIIDTPLGERIRFTSVRSWVGGRIHVEIARGEGKVETLELSVSPEDPHVLLSPSPPEEPHEFTAQLLFAGESGETDGVSFTVSEPDGHAHSHEHNHAHLDDEAHARAHTETLPDYVKAGDRPTLGQIVVFGAAGGMIPCPASITVMLLAVSSGRTAMGLVTVLGFSLGLALALVSVGVAIVSGLSRLSSAGRLSWLTRHAPVASAALVIVSGLFAILIAH